MAMWSLITNLTLYQPFNIGGQCNLFEHTLDLVLLGFRPQTAHKTTLSIFLILTTPTH